MQQINSTANVKQLILEISNICNSMLEDELNNYWISSEEIHEYLLEDKVRRIRNNLKAFQYNLREDIPF